jgi:hypothetical protein
MPHHGGFSRGLAPKKFDVPLQIPGFAGLNPGNFTRAVRQPSKQHGIEKSAPQQDGNDEVNNRDFDRAKASVMHSSPQPHSLPFVCEDPSGRKQFVDRS